MTVVSPWIERFRHIADENDVASLSKFAPPPLTNLHLHNVEMACNDLEKNFDQLFIPTSNTNSILKKMHDLAAAHATVMYPDSKTFLKGIYSEGEFPNEIRPFFLTGPAGAGKSHIFKAYTRIQPHDSHVHLDLHGEFLLKAAWIIGIQEKISPQLALQKLVKREEIENRKSLSVKECQRIAFRDGVCLLLLDELQFLSQSKASTLITSLLTIFTYIGLPMIFAANYSLGHKLKSRTQENKQRFLARPLLLLPDLADSQDWIDTLSGYVDVAPETFQINCEKDALQIHGWCAGLKRLLKDLFLIAYRIARADKRQVADISDFKSAYLSTEYGENRRDVRDMREQEINISPGKRLDLYCPFDLPDSRTAASSKQAKDVHLAETSEAIRDQNLQISERRVLQNLKRGAREKNTLRVGKTKTQVSMESFQKGEEMFRKQSK